MRTETNNKTQTNQPRQHGFYGWYFFDGHQKLNIRETLESMNSGFNTNIDKENQQTNSCAIASTSQVLRLGKTGMVTIIGKPMWQSRELIELANLQGATSALLRAYRTEGEDFLGQVQGNFSYAIIDSDNHQAYIGIDRLGQQCLYYTITEGQLIFGTTVKSVTHHPLVKPELNPQGIYNYVYFHMVPSPGSIFKNVSKLQAGNKITIKGANCTTSRYWSPTFTNNHHNFRDLQASLKTHLKNSVSKLITNESSVGSFLSGGLDSSTVTGILSDITERQAPAFSIGFSADGYDEMAYARITAKHFGVKLHEYYVTPEDVLNALPLVASSYDEPFGNSSALPAWFCASFAKEHGVDTLLAGDGGDELFAGNSRYAKQKMFRYFNQLPNALRDYVLAPMFIHLPDINPISKVKSYVEQARTPLPDRLQNYNFLHQHKPNEIFSESFLANVNTNYPVELQRDIYNTPEQATELNRMLYLDWQLTLADNDLRKVSQMCMLADVDVDYPMLDDDLIAFSTSIPDHTKLKGQKLRYFYKRALSGWLPNGTINKKKQGFGLPFGIWLQDYKPLQEMVNDQLTDLNNRKIIKPCFIDSLILMHKNRHAGYYGELIWILVILNIWLSGAFYEKNTYNSQPNSIA